MVWDHTLFTFSAIGTTAAAWVIWYMRVLRPMAKSVEPGSPAWLRIFLSGLYYKFSKTWLQFSHNLDEMVESGRLDPSRTAILVVGPHGQYTISALAFYSHWVAKGWPWKNMNCVVADVLLSLPVVGDYLILVKTKPATSEMMTALLQAGNTLAMYPGGIYEQVRTDAEEEALYFPSRLSFVRIAIQNGVDLVPLYSFGENQLYPTSKSFMSFNGWVYRKTGIGNILLHSPILKLPTSVLLPSPLLMPRYQGEVHCRFGDQIRTGPADPDPTEQQVLAVFERYVAAVGRLFMEHKDACLPPAVAARGLTVHLRATKDRKAKVWKFGQPAGPSKL